MSRRAGLVWPVAVFTLAYALLAVASGLDRFSEHRPSVARLVPSVLHANAFTVAAGEALRKGELEVAAARAGDAIGRDPLDARAVAILGAALQLEGNAAGARAAFTQAATLGWRQPLVQSYWFLHDWRQGRAATAMVQLDALLRSHPEFEPARQFLTVAESDPRGLAALAKRLSADTRWTRDYLAAREVSDPVLRGRAQLLVSGVGRGVSLGCDRILPLVRELAVRNYRGDAERVLDRHCPSARERAPLADTDFADIASASRTGLGWRQHGGGDVLVSQLDAAKGGIELTNRSSVTQLALTQPVALPAGRYRLQIRFKEGAPSQLLAALDCGTPTRPKGNLVGGSAWLVAQDCPNQLLSIWLRPGGEPVSVEAIDLQASSAP